MVRWGPALHGHGVAGKHGVWAYAGCIFGGNEGDLLAIFFVVGGLYVGCVHQDPEDGFSRPLYTEKNYEINQEGLPLVVKVVDP